MIRLISTSMIVAVMVCMASPLLAQRNRGRNGFWLSGEAGVTYASVECGTICYSDAFIAPTGIVQIGGSPSEKAMIALELSYWRVSADSTARDYGVGMAVLRFYPLRDSPLFVKFGAGVGRYGEERVPEEGTRWALSAHGFALQVGAGYDFPLAARIRIGPAVSFVSALSHKAQRNRLPTTDMTGKFLRVAAQITWQ